MSATGTPRAGFPPISRCYTGVGSRQTPEDVLQHFAFVAERLGEEGWTLRSGGADGADKGFECCARSKEIFLPWKKFNSNPSQFYPPSEEAVRIARDLLGADHWNRLTGPGRLLHARNVHQVLGLHLNNPSKFLLCWTPGGKAVGGTRTAIRLAIEHKVPVINAFGMTGEQFSLAVQEIAHG